MMRTLSLLVLGLAINGFAYATPDSLPKNLVKVTKENNPKCVLFVSYKGEMYCSLVDVKQDVVPPEVIANERQIIKFDDRPWKASWGKNTPQITTIEYTPFGENVANWKELITTQFIPTTTDMTPMDFGNRVIANLKTSGADVDTKIMKSSPDEFMFEFKVKAPSNLHVDEIQKIIKKKDGFYILHYAMKKTDMGKANRDKWVGHLNDSRVK